MGSTNRGFSWPEGSDAPDGPGAFYALAQEVQTQFDQYDGFVHAQVQALRDEVNGDFSSRLAEGSWTPTLGGGNGVYIGDNASASGDYVRVLRKASVWGRIVFGSSASFGTGQATVQNLPMGINPDTAVGIGWYYRAGANTAVGIEFLPANSTTFVIRPINNGDLGLGFNLGSIAQSSQLVFHIEGTAA